MKNRIEGFLEELSYNSSFRILEEGKDKDKLTEIAEKRGIKLPCNDLAIFECIYAFTDKRNLNGCTLPREQVKSAIETLNGKAIDFDHFRKNVVGTWLDAELKKDIIIAYGCFYKGNFPEDYEYIKGLMENDVLAISFEAYGIKENMTGDGNYDLTDIEFAGGTLLIKTKPAFPGSKVTDMANKRILEFAKVMTPPEKFIHFGKEVEKGIGKEEFTETARFYSSDIEIIARLISEVDCMGCKEKGFFSILAIDFENNTSRIKCINCEAVMTATLTPSSKLNKKGRKVKAIAYTHPEEVAKETLEKLFPIHDPSDVNKALSKLEEPDTQETLKQLGVSIDSVKENILIKAKEINMEELLKKFKVETVEALVQAIAKDEIDRELTAEELESAYTIVDYKKPKGDANDTSVNDKSGKGKSTSNPTSLMSATEEEIREAVKEVTTASEEDKNNKTIEVKDEEIATLTAELVKVKAENEKMKDKLAKIEKAKRDAEINKRRNELGDFAKKLTDDDIMDENKYTIAKKDKEIADLKAGKKVDNDTDIKPDLTKGSDDKDTQDSGKKVRSLAWGKDKDQE